MLPIALISLTLALAGGEATWEGHLFRDAEGRVRLGWPVVAMGVMARAPHVIEGDLARRLEPLVSRAKDDYVFWNYELEEEGDPASRALPAALVRLRGTASGSDDAMGPLERQTSAVTLSNARLLEVEFVDPEWLRHWALFFRDKASPFRVARERDESPESLARFARAALEALKAMRAVPGPGPDAVAAARAIDPGVRVASRFRTRVENDIQRFLADLAAKKTVALEGIDALPPLPPSSVELQRLFLGAKDKAAFLAATRALYAGDLAAVDLVHYVTDGRGSTWHESTPLDVVRDEWSEETFASSREATRSVLGNGRAR